MEKLREKFFAVYSPKEGLAKLKWAGFSLLHRMRVFLRWLRRNLEGHMPRAMEKLSNKKHEPFILRKKSN
jgi:hypothetical protein